MKKIHLERGEERREKVGPSQPPQPSRDVWGEVRGVGMKAGRETLINVVSFVLLVI